MAIPKSDRVRDGLLLRLVRLSLLALSKSPTSAPGEPESAKARPQWWRALPGAFRISAPLNAGLEVLKREQARFLAPIGITTAA